MKVPRDFDIRAPSTVMKPCTCTLVGVRKSDCDSTAGQNRQWKLTMSLPIT